MDFRGHVKEVSYEKRSLLSISVMDQVALSDALNPSYQLFSNPQEHDHLVASVHAERQPQGIDAEKLAENWGIGIEKAKQTLKVTTQRGIRTIVHPTLSRRF